MRCVLRVLYACGIALLIAGLLNNSIFLHIVGCLLIGVGSAGWED